MIREMRAMLDEYDDRMMVGETYVPLADLVKYYGENLDECHLPFNFRLIEPKDVELENGRSVPWNAAFVRGIVDQYEAALPPGAWPNWVLGNHDQHRIASRIGLDQARVAQMMLLTLRGTPTCYYGDELAMTDVEIPPEKEQDPWGKQVPGLALGRDPERTPMQWNSAPYAGFSTPEAEPWLPVGDAYVMVNVETEQQDPTSPLSFFRRLVQLRRDTPALAVGSYQSVDAGQEEVYAYVREHASARVLVALNFGTGQHALNLGQAGTAGRVLLSTHMDRESEAELSALELRPNEGVIVELGTGNK